MSLVEQASAPPCTAGSRVLPGVKKIKIRYRRVPRVVGRGWVHRMVCRWWVPGWCVYLYLALLYPGIAVPRPSSTLT